MNHKMFLFPILGLIVVLLSFTVPAATMAREKGNAYTSSTVGYAEDLSIYNADGNIVKFHLSSLSWQPPTTTIFVYKIGEDKLIPIDGQSGIVIPGSSLQQLDCKQSELGCDWPLVYSLDVSGWESGLYYAYLVDGNLSTPPPNIIIGGDTNEHFNYIPFIIKSADPTNTILVQLPANTWHAWNGWNNGAYYYSNPNTTILSFQRPFDRKFVAIKEDSYVFLRWLYDNGYSFDVATDLDIEEPTLVSRYKLVIPVGHGEYWTVAMYDSLAHFRDNGGNILFFTSNTMYWRNRHTSAAKTLESYKIAWLSEDPCYDPSAPDYTPELVTSYFSPPRLPYSKDAIDWEHNDIKLLGIHGDEVPGVGGYVFYQTQNEDVSWIFSGTGLTDGQRIGELIGETEGEGQNEPQVGAAGSKEVDRVRFVFQNGIPVVDRTDWTQLEKCDPDSPDFDENYCVKYAPAPDAPENLMIIGLGDSSNRQQDPGARSAFTGATMAIYKTDDACAWGECSTVVHVGSWNWVTKALNPDISNYDPRFNVMTKNLINRMSGGEAVSSAPIQRYEVATFQEGVAGYSGFVDSTISYSSIDPDIENLRVRGLGSQYALIKADISFVPKDAEITSAALLLYGAKAGYDDNTMLIDARQVLSEWDETTTHLPDVDFDEITTARIKIHLSGEGEGKRDWGKDKWHSFNITPFVKKWHADPATNFGVLLYNPSNNLYYLFRSSDYSNVQYRPILLIVYKVALMDSGLYLPLVLTRSDQSAQTAIPQTPTPSKTTTAIPPNGIF